MRIFLCDTGNIPQDVIKKAAQALPRERAPKENMHADALTARVVGTMLVQYAIKQLSPETVCEKWSVSPQGKPCLENSPIHFNIAHTDGFVAVAASENHPVGVDVEKVRPMRDGFASRYFDEREQTAIRAATDPDEALIRLWTAKEAVGKYHGTGLGDNIAAIDTQNAVTTVFEKSDARYALSLVPKGELPPLEWVDFANLVP